MTYRIIEIFAQEGSRKAITSAVEGSGGLGSWEMRAAREGEDLYFSVLIKAEDTQPLLDKLQAILGHSATARIVVLPVETTLPKPEEAPEKKKKAGKAAVSREELYDDVARGATYNRNFVFLVVFSTLVAAIGLIEDNIAVVIGAMVIAPLLGPNLALALSTTLGDVQLMLKAVKTNLIGLTITVGMAVAIGYFWPGELNSEELLLRTDVGFDGVTLALASGAAAVLSLTTGLPSVLVGVMVAVALLPPAAVMGIMLGAGRHEEAFGALLLLVVNVVCVNLAAKLVFFYEGIRPRTWYEKQKATRSMLISTAAWLIALIVLSMAIYLRGGVGF